MQLIDQQYVLAILDRQDAKTLWAWYARHQWFPAPATQGRPPKWIDQAIVDWIDKTLPQLYEDGASIPELKTWAEAVAYARACKDRLDRVLQQMAEDEKAFQEKLKRQRSILRVYHSKDLVTA